MKNLLLVLVVAFLSTFTFAQDSTTILKVELREFNFAESGSLIAKGAKLKNIGWGVNGGTVAFGSVLIFGNTGKDNKSAINTGTGLIVIGTLTNVVLQIVGNNFIKKGGIKLATQGVGISYTIK